MSNQRINDGLAFLARQDARRKEEAKREEQRQLSADLRTGLSHADVLASVFRRDVERVLSQLDEHGEVSTTYGTASVFYEGHANYSAYSRLQFVLPYMEACGLIYSEVKHSPSKHTLWRRIPRPSDG